MGIQTMSLGERLRAPLSAQIKDSIPTFIYLMQKSGSSFEAYKGNMAGSTNYVRPGMQDMMPRYYSDSQLLPRFKGWVEVTSFTKANEKEIAHLAMYSTGTQLLYVLQRSMFSFGSVYVSRHEPPRSCP